MAELNTKCTIRRDMFNMSESDVSKIVKNSMSNNVNMLTKDISRLFDELRPIAEQHFTIMKNKHVWFDRYNVALYPRFEHFELPQFIVSGNQTAKYSTNFEGFQFFGINRMECMRSFLVKSNNPYLQADGKYRFFSNKDPNENDTIITGEIWDDDSRVWCCRSDGAVYTDDNEKRSLTLVPICRLEKNPTRRPSFMDVIWLWIQNDLLPEGLSVAVEEKFSNLLKIRRYLINKKAEIRDNALKSVPNIFHRLKSIAEKKFTMMHGRRLLFDRDNAAVYPYFNIHQEGYDRYDTKKTYRDFQVTIENFKFTAMTRYECVRSFVRNVQNPYLDVKSDTLMNCSAYQKNHIITVESSKNGECWVCDTHGGCFLRNESNNLTIIPIHHFCEKNSDSMNYIEVITAWIEYGLIPEGLENGIEQEYRQILADEKQKKEVKEFCNKYTQSLCSKEIISLDINRLVGDIYSGEFTDTLFGYDFDLTERAKRILHRDEKLTEAPIAIYANLLNCDNTRANLSPYPPRILTDINMGHWELYEQMKNPPEDSVAVALAEAIYARPPQLDVQSSGICAIDFGTKSTVVVCRNREERLLRVGKADYHKKPAMEDYENPTAMELRDLVGFQKAYNGREGRPFTEWEQITVSHQALSRLVENEGQSIYQSVFSELKQWANEKKAVRRLRDQKGNDILLPAYGDLGDKDFDPIEVYAYYLGLYINNMVNGIYLEYILSFPVNYEKSVRTHLRDSFERGIRKSLPPSILQDEELMEDFRVYGGAGEPAAYASCALKELGKVYPEMRPTEEQPIYYGVFDFGGGTTDFDYGIWRLPASGDKGDWNFVIEHFNAGGDVNLGGEKLLNLLAYEVYQNNVDKMREQGIPFARPEGARPFVGSEMLLTESDAAYLNRRRLSELLRPIWEEKTEYEKMADQPQEVKLYRDADMVSVQLKVEVQTLREILKEHIALGVRNFFVGMFQAFREIPVPVYHILMAGNSCKSSLVKEAFREEMKRQEENIKVGAMSAQGQEKDFSGIFRLHLPLGNEKQDREALSFDRIPTGKTGVAFGLLDCRKGGHDVLVIDRNLSAEKEALFRYYLGYSDRADKFHVLIGKGVGYREWVPFFYTTDDRFELYFSSEPRALENQMDITEVPAPKKCRIHYMDGHDEGRIYIRKVAPNRIEYTVAGDDGIVGEKYWAKVESCELGE